MSVETTAPAMTPEQFNSRVQSYIAGLGFATQTDLGAATAPLATKAEVTAAIGGITFPPVPYNVPQSVVTLGNGVLAGLRADRNLTLKGYTYKLVSLTGLNALLNIELRKNGTVIPGSSVSLDTASLTATVVLGSVVPLVMGDTVELWRTGLLGTAPVPGGMYGTFVLS